MILKDLPNLEKPREKAFKYGFSKLSNCEVLALLLGCGTKGKSVIELSYELLNNFKGISNLKNINLNELIKIKGISYAKATTLLAALELSKRLNDNIEVGCKISNGQDVYNLIMKKALYQ